MRQYVSLPLNCKVKYYAGPGFLEKLFTVFRKNWLFQQSTEASLTRNGRDADS